MKMKTTTNGPEVELKETGRAWMIKTYRQLNSFVSGAAALSLILTVASVMTTGCQPGPTGATGSPGARGEAGTSAGPTAAGINSPSPSGGSSDGGGFVSENSKIL